MIVEIPYFPHDCLSLPFAGLSLPSSDVPGQPIDVLGAVEGDDDFFMRRDAIPELPLHDTLGINADEELLLGQFLSPVVPLPFFSASLREQKLILMSIRRSLNSICL